MEISESIAKRTEKSGKTYGFQDARNPFLPAQHWYQKSHEGDILFLVFYTQACRWAQCLGCNLPSQMSQGHISFEPIMKQVDFVFDYLVSPENRDKIQKIILSNNGSVLDEDTFSTTALVYFIAKMNQSCPEVHTLTLETRAEYVDLEELEILSRVLREGAMKTKLELAIGFEAFNDYIRNDVFLKGLSLKVFEDLVSRVARHSFKLKIYFMIKPVPEMSEQEAVDDVKKGMDYLDLLAQTYDVEINMHLNPTYVALGTPLEAAFVEGRFSPPKVESIREIILHGEGKSLSLFLGMFDEGLAVEGGSSFHSGNRAEWAPFETFNQTQNFELLK